MVWIKGETKLKTKYNWCGVPIGVKWISTDWEGWKLYHTNEPRICPLSGLCYSSLEPDGYLDFLQCFNPSENEFKGDWEQSLEERPK